MDIFGALVGITITLPILLIISFLYLSGKNKGPIFFSQKRVGKDGEVFRIYKFRSMIVNAEETLKKDSKLYEKYIKNSYKLEPNEDPRITSVGRFLRKTSLDELPQLFNVLRGDMSLVGPRPVVNEELKEYGTRLNEFLSVKPGLTGYWQISGRSEVGYPERAELELYYVYNQSLILDVRIIFFTIYQVFLRKGAY
ncbi:sugar transferase [Priestia aryabhattai]